MNLYEVTYQSFGDANMQLVAAYSENDAIKKVNRYVLNDGIVLVRD